MTHDEETRASGPEHDTETKTPAFWNEPEAETPERRSPSRGLVIAVALTSVLVLALALGALALTRGQKDASPPPSDPATSSDARSTSSSRPTA